MHITANNIFLFDHHGQLISVAITMLGSPHLLRLLFTLIFTSVT